MRMQATLGDSRVQVRLVNPREAAVQLILEPWGEVYIIPPDDVVDITVQGPAGEALEIAHEADAIVVWGWPGSTIQVFHGAKELGSVQVRPPVPRSSSDTTTTRDRASDENGAGGPERTTQGAAVRASEGEKR